ncbi:DUF928 domain-containing protein [Nostoc punctiforme UO1]|uniref:DUF928 domain-containing protein n=1 Tax=Nostoc punctiforme TaxID=272131 RepID=UPI0030B3D771
MSIKKLIFSKHSLVISLSWVMAGLTSYPISVLAESTSSTINSPFFITQSSQKPKLDFSSTGRPNRQTDAASRGNCDGIEEKELTALVPKDGGLTISEYPTFWVYVPNDPKDIRYAELVLQDEAEQKTIERTRYTLQSRPGFVSVTVPSKPKNPLKQGKIYNWYFRLVCNSGNSFDVSGTVERVSSSSAVINDYQSLLNNKLWYDALNNLGERRRRNPQDPTLNKQWADLLEANGVDLERLTQESGFGTVVPQS